MKRKLLVFILDLLFVAVFNVCFFVIGGTQHSVPVWIAYGMVHLAYLTVIICPIIKEKSDSDYLFVTTSFMVSGVFFGITLLLAIIMFALETQGVEPINQTWAIVIFSVLFALFLAAFIIMMLANDATAKSLKVQKQEVEYIKTCANKVKRLVDKLTDRNTKKQVERVYDLLHASPTKSNERVKSYEINIYNSIKELEEAVLVNDATSIASLCNKITNLIEDRNINLN